MADREPRDGGGQRVAVVHGLIPLRAKTIARKGNFRQETVSRYLGYFPTISQMCNCCCGDDVMLKRAWTTLKSRKYRVLREGNSNERSALCIGMR